MSKHMTYTCIYVFPINTHIHTPTSFFSLRTFHRHNPLSRLRPSLAVVVPMFPFKEFSRIEMTMTIFCGSLCMKLYKKNLYSMPLPVQCLHFACVCSQRKSCAGCTSFMMQFYNHQLWPFTKINITCDPRPQLAHSKAGPPAEMGCFGGGGLLSC